jgi:hypothetical protein
MPTGRFDRTDLAVLALLATAAPVLLLLGLGMTFFLDEWSFITDRSLADPVTWIEPHNEHWSTIPILIYRVLVETVGLTSHVPYHTVVVAIHLVVVALAYKLIRSRSGAVPAAVIAVILIFFGSGVDNIFWSFQIGFTGATALCLAGLVVLDRDATMRRALLVMALQLAALASHGAGLAMLAVVATAMALRPDWRRYIWIVAVSVAVYALWFVVFGIHGVGAQGDPASLSALVNVPGSVLIGFGSAAQSWIGLPAIPAAAVSLTVIAVVARIRSPDTLPVRAIACLAGVVSLYVLVGLSRSSHGLESSEASRITYFSGTLFIVGLSDLVGPIRLPQVGSARRSVALAGVAVPLTLCVVWNLAFFIQGREYLLEWAQLTRAMMVVELDPSVPSSTALPNGTLVPPRAVLRQVVERYGSPLEDRGLPPLSPVALAKVRQYFFESGAFPQPS